MLRNESLAVGVNVDVAVRLFITVPFCRGVEASYDRRQRSTKSDTTSNTTACQMLMETIQAAAFQSLAKRTKN